VIPLKYYLLETEEVKVTSEGGPTCYNMPEERRKGCQEAKNKLRDLII